MVTSLIRAQALTNRKASLLGMPESVIGELLPTAPSSANDGFALLSCRQVAMIPVPSRGLRLQTSAQHRAPVCRFTAPRRSGQSRLNFHHGLTH